MITKENDKFLVHEHDIIYRNGQKLENIKPNRKKNFSLKIGDVIERKLRNGDILLLNRQPTLHRGSMTQKVRLIQGKTIRLNLAVTNSFSL